MLTNALQQQMEQCWRRLGEALTQAGLHCSEGLRGCYTVCHKNNLGSTAEGCWTPCRAFLALARTPCQHLWRWHLVDTGCHSREQGTAQTVRRAQAGNCVLCCERHSQRPG